METNWPDSPAGASLGEGAGIAELVAYFYEWGVIIGVIIFFAILLWSSFEYMTSTGNPGKVKNAKSRIVSGISGVLLLFGSYIILNTINPELSQISHIAPPNISVGFQEFQAGIASEENMCEFAFVTTQEKESPEVEKIHFMIPGMKIQTDDVFPTESHACVPERDESKILEVRENKDSRYMTLVTRIDGREFYQEEEEKIETRVYRYYNGEDGIEASRHNALIQERMENEWCPKICGEVDCSGVYSLCDYNIAEKIRSGYISSGEYANALESSGYYEEGYPNQQRDTINDHLSLGGNINELRRLIFENVLDALYDTPENYRDMVERIYSSRYEKMEYPGIASTQESIYDFLYQAKERESYNIFDDCERIISDERFNRPRCLELNYVYKGGMDPNEEYPPDEIHIKEWRRRGYASLTQAWEAIGEDKGNLDFIITCPDNYDIARHNENLDEEDAENILGYKRDSSGGGCSIAFYDGVRRDWSWGGWGRETPTCEKKISRPSADMDHFEGLVDRESNCMELIRHEPPLDLREDKIITVTLDRTEITQLTNAMVYFCEGRLELHHHRNTCPGNFIRSCRYGSCIEKEFEIRAGDYTVLIRGGSPNYDYYFEDIDQCEVVGDIDKHLHTSRDRNCLIRLTDDATFKVKEEPIEIEDSIVLNSAKTRTLTTNMSCSSYCDVFEGGARCESIGTNESADNNKYVGRNFAFQCREYEGDCSTVLESPFWTKPTCPSQYDSEDIQEIEWTYCNCVHD